jgi:hypothetical protein
LYDYEFLLWARFSKVSGGKDLGRDEICRIIFPDLGRYEPTRQRLRVASKYLKDFINPSNFRRTAFA